MGTGAMAGAQAENPPLRAGRHIGGPRFDQDDKKRPRYIFIQNERRSRMLQNGQTSHIPWPFEKFSSYPYNPFATTSLYVFEFGYKAPTHHLKESSL
jgi:hypothetical protein